MTGSGPATTLLKNCKICKIFQNSSFLEQIRSTASGKKKRGSFSENKWNQQKLKQVKNLLLELLKMKMEPSLKNFCFYHGFHFDQAFIYTEAAAESSFETGNRLC